MKKYLFALLACLAAAWSCKVEGTYYAENMQDIVTVKNKELITDNGVVLNLTQNNAGTLPEWQEGARYFIVFDVLNKDLDIRLLSVRPVTIQAAQPADEEEVLPHDPVIIQFNWIGGGYLNLGIAYYKAKDSQYQHSFQLRYTKEEATSTLHLFLYHDGNGESPVAMTSDKLVIDDTIFSIPLGETLPQGLSLTFDVLRQTSDGKYTVAQQTVNKY